MRVDAPEKGTTPDLVSYERDFPAEACTNTMNHHLVNHSNTFMTYECILRFKIYKH